MTKMLEDMLDHRDELEELIKAASTMVACPMPTRYNASANKIIVAIEYVSELHIVREYLRRHFGQWEDYMSTKWVSSGKAMVAWRGKAGYAPIEIWMSCPIAIFPDSLKGNCTFEEVTETRLELVCNI